MSRLAELVEAMAAFDRDAPEACADMRLLLRTISERDVFGLATVPNAYGEIRVGWWIAWGAERPATAASLQHFRTFDDLLEEIVPRRYWADAAALREYVEDAAIVVAEAL